MKIRYVVVDDAAFIRELLKGLLASSGHVCVGEAEDGREAVDVVARTLPDVVFMDLVLPRRNGVDVAREIKDLWPEGKIVACTTLTESELPVPAEPNLFAAWIDKPFTKEDVDRKLRELFSGDKETSV